MAWNVQVLLVFCIARCALTLWLFSHWHHIQTYTRGAGSFRLLLSLGVVVKLWCRYKRRGNVQLPIFVAAAAAAHSCFATNAQLVLAHTWDNSDFVTLATAHIYT